MPTRDLVILLSVFVMVVVMVVVFFYPSEEKKRKKKRAKDLEAALPKDTQEWKETAEKLREQIKDMYREIDAQERNKKKFEEALMQEREKSAKLEERVRKEKQWFADQQGAVDKANNEVRQTRIELTQAQTEREKEFSLRLSSDRQQEDLKKDLDAVKREKKDLLHKITQLEFTINTQKEELAELKAANREYKEKIAKKEQTEAQWIAKAEYLKLEKKLQDFEKALQDKEREIQKIKEIRRL